MQSLRRFSFWSSSIRHQLVSALGAVSLVLLLGAGFLLHAHQRDFLYDQGLKRATSLAHALAVSSASWVLANDLAGLQEVTEGFAIETDLKFAVVLSPQGEILSSTVAGQAGRFFTDPLSRRLSTARAEPMVLVSSRNLVDVAAPILVGARQIGWARVELTQDTANRHLRDVTYAGFLFAFIGLGVSVVVAWLLARRLSAPLDRLVRVVADVTRRGAGERAPVQGAREIASLARDFNGMLDTLEGQQRAIEWRNTQLALHNDILQRLSEGHSLRDVLQEFAQRIGALEGVACAIYLLGVDGRHLDLIASAGIGEKFLARIPRLDALRGTGTSVTAARDKVRAVTPDVRADPHWAAYADWIGEAHVLSCWSQPILRQSRVLGVLAFYRDRVGEPDAAEVELIEHGAQLIGLAIERQRQEEALRIAATAFETQEAMYILDAERNIQRVNRAFSRITGLTPEEVVGRPVSILRSGHHDEAFYQRMWSEVQRTGAWQGEVTNQRQDGEVYSKWLNITAVYDEQGRISHYVAGFFDVTQRKQAEAAIERLAFYDPLTGLPNRRLLLDRVRQALAGVRRSQRRGALLFLDLDNFKALNDTQGHDKGDLLLQEVAQRLQQCVRQSDTVARLGGDEFVVMLDGLGPGQEEAAQEAEKVSQKVLQALRLEYDLGGVPHHSSSSIGVTLFDAGDESVEDLLKRADLALYQAKAAGRNAVRFFDPAMQASMTARVALEADMRQALEARQFVLLYQPQVDGTGQVTGSEALVRWQHPERGLVSPGEFIEQAEESGLILPLGQQVLELACEQLVRWAGMPDMQRLTLSVNVSARQLHQPGFVAQVLEALARTGANPQRLKLELTESLLLENVGDTISKMTQLKARGVGFSLDDFGTGYSSLHYLKRLPLDQLKIDASFVQDALTNANDAAIVQAIVALGHSLGLHVIAEGVETLAQREFLARLGCYACQGYLFGRPGPAEALEALVARRAQPVSF